MVLTAILWPIYTCLGACLPPKRLLATLKQHPGDSRLVFCVLDPQSLVCDWESNWLIMGGVPEKATVLLQPGTQGNGVASYLVLSA